MFILRTAFWLSVVVLLLPADPTSGVQAPRVSAIEALSAARTVVADLSAFCDRNPDVCATGGSAFQLFTQKVRYGTQRLYDYFDGAPAAGGEPSTLKRDDMEPSWRGPPEDGKSA